MSNLKPYDMKEPVPSKDNYKKSPWFKQNAFEKGEMKKGPFIGFAIGVVLFVVIGFKFGVLGFLIKKTPTVRSLLGRRGDTVTTACGRRPRA